MTQKRFAGPPVNDGNEIYMAMNHSKNPITQDQRCIPPPACYYSVEFLANTIHSIYQFKLWRSDRNCVFLLIKEGSEILPQLKPGHILPMKYYSNDALQAIEIHDTQIKAIVNEKQGRFQGHYRVELGIITPGA